MIPRAIVTGAAGFVGCHIVDRLLLDGFQVIGIDNFALGKAENLKNAFGSQNFQLLEYDLSKLDPVLRAIEDQMLQGPVEIVWHMAANSDISAGVTDPYVDLNATFMTTFNTLEIMRTFEIGKIAFASTSAVYGEHMGKVTEDVGPCLPISNYGAMKLASEAVVSAAVESFLERAWLFRFPNVIGDRLTHGAVYDFMSKLRTNPEELEVLGDGNQQKEYIHVNELLDAMFFIVDNGMEQINIFNIGSNDDGATVRFLADTVISAFAPGARKRFTGGTKGWVGDVPRFNYSTRKLQGLGWQPNLSSEQAVVQAVRELVTEQS
jgi:UDP-glucose 4-epimerase